MEEKGTVTKDAARGLSEWESKMENIKRRFPVLSDVDLVMNQDTAKESFAILARKLGLSPDELDMVIMTS